MGRVGFEPTITGAQDQYLDQAVPTLGGLDHRPLSRGSMYPEDKSIR